MIASSLILLFLKGLLIGFVIAAPIGPIGILCIQRTMSGRYGLSLMTGLGAGVADTVYGAIAGFSLVSIANFITQYGFYLQLFGGMLLGWIGFSIFRSPLRQESLETRSKETLFHGFTSAFFLTLSNPIALIVFAAAFTVMGIVPQDESLDQGLALVSGVFVGANGWWLALSTTIHMIHHKLSETNLLWINRISGGMLLGFGAYMLLSLL